VISWGVARMAGGGTVPDRLGVGAGTSLQTIGAPFRAWTVAGPQRVRPVTVALQACRPCRREAVAAEAAAAASEATVVVGAEAAAASAEAAAVVEAEAAVVAVAEGGDSHEQIPTTSTRIFEGDEHDPTGNE
jgi:hypothetical protein